MNLSIQKGPYLVVNEWDYVEGTAAESENIWYTSKAKKINSSAVLYKSVDRSKLVLLYQVDNLQELQDFLESDEYKRFTEDLTPFMASDFHQGVYGLHDTVKSRKQFVPTTPFMQLRSIEVPLSGINDYLEWRKGTIFEFVKRNPLVESFLAFHSFFSSDPGVLFVAEFNEDPVAFKESFLTPEYQVIIKEAGHDHIKGGLHTYEYQLTTHNAVSYS
jgi:hypothetical protein